MYQIAIPSLGRADRLCGTSVRLLADGAADLEAVTVFVIDAEAAEYRVALDAAGFGSVALKATQRGMATVRNTINAAYPADSLLVQIDDDVRDVRRLVPGSTKLKSVPNLDRLFREGFRYMAQAGATLWGPYPSSNPLSMKAGRVDFGLGLVAGPLFGHVVKHGPEFDITVPAKTDYEFTLAHWMHGGGICRLRDVCTITKFRAHGGMGDDAARLEREAEGARTLVARHPSMLRFADERRSGAVELRFRR